MSLLPKNQLLSGRRTNELDPTLALLWPKYGGFDPMWIINSPKRHKAQSPDYGWKAPDQPLKYFFQIRDKKNRPVASGKSSEYCDPGPLWLAGMKLGGESIWYLNPSSFLYERYIPHRDRYL